MKPFGFIIVLFTFETKWFYIMNRDVFQAIADPTRRQIIGPFGRQ